MSFVIPAALQSHFFSKNKNIAGCMQKLNRTLLAMTPKIQKDFLFDLGLLLLPLK